MDAKPKFLTNRYYILYVRDLWDIKCLPYSFPSRDTAKATIKSQIPWKDRKPFRVVSGNFIRKYQVKLYKKIILYPAKYKYPADKIDPQQRKTYRTVMRRRLRRMGILVKGKATGMVGGKTYQLRSVKNKQKVAKSPNSIARVLQVDSKGIHNYYLIMKILPNPRTGDLCYCKAWAFNIKKRTIKKVQLRIANRDIVTPHLTTHLIDLCLKKQMPVPPKLWMKLSTKRLSPLKNELSKGG